MRCEVQQADRATSPVMNRRALLLGSMALAAGAALPAQAHPGAVEWRVFRDRYISADGRVIDTGNGGVSHSEGQGYGMLLAVAYGGQEDFDRLWNWTLAHLSRGEDKLLSWRFNPSTRGQDPSNLNNASDGDLLVAWALCRAAVKWRSAEHLRRAKAMATDFLRLNTVEVAGRLLMRPGTVGFDHGEHVVVNPSYAVFSAMRELNAMQPDPRWTRLEEGMLAVIREARFSSLRLVPDWVEAPRAGGRFRLASEWPQRFSWDAVRVPLYMVWAGLQNHPALDPLMEVWFDPARGASPPAWWDLRGETPAPYGATPGIVAVARLLLASRLGQSSGRPIPFPAAGDGQDYYNAVLVLLCHLATDEVLAHGSYREASI